MTQGDIAFYKRRQREEIAKAFAASSPYLRRLHSRWAALYEARLNGMPKAKVASLENALLREERGGAIPSAECQQAATSPLRLAA